MSMSWKTGLRIVDLNELARQMYCRECELVLDLNRTECESQFGLASVLKIICQCGVANEVHTSTRLLNQELNHDNLVYDINFKATIGLLTSQEGEKTMLNFLAVLNIPTTTFKVSPKDQKVTHHHDQSGIVWQNQTQYAPLDEQAYSCASSASSPLPAVNKDKGFLEFAHESESSVPTPPLAEMTGQSVAAGVQDSHVQHLTVTQPLPDSTKGVQDSQVEHPSVTQPLPDSTKWQHGEKDTYNCKDCGEVFSKISSLKYHKRKHKNEKPFTCDICHQIFSDKYNLARHKNRHQGLKPFQCEVCGSKFSEKGNLKVHMRCHSGEKPFKCEFCGESFHVSSPLKVHRRTHTGERPFLCDLCGASFAQGSKLRSHRRHHTGEKPYFCGECGETFREKQQLNIHQRKHTGIQPYTCEVCGKFLQNASHLTNHMRLHTGEKPYTCEICGQKFSRSDVLGQHRRKHSTATLKQNQVSSTDQSQSK